MPTWLADVPIERADVLTIVYVAAGLLAVALLIPAPGLRGRVRTRLGLNALGAGIGAAAAAALVWWEVDVQDLFGAPASDVVRAGATAAGAGAGLAVANLLRTRWWRKAVAVVAAAAAVTAGGVMINRDAAYYPRLGDAFGATGVTSLAIDADTQAAEALRAWRPPAGMPAHGTVGTVRIPGAVSRWHARDAWVYLPPAALVRHPPRLPVMIALSGQPGAPADLFLAGGLKAPLDALAAAHLGVAPIVVVPDQLGSAGANPMCINSRLGDVATYITVDVRDWILHHLPVSTSRREWTVAGFSEGATCAVQFGTGNPALFGSFIAVSPEPGPRDGTLARTIADGWNGDARAFAAAQPVAVMQRTKRYPATTAVYSVGDRDRRYSHVAGMLAAASRRAGMHVAYRGFVGLAHNWNTGAAGLRYGLAELTRWWRLP